MISVENYISIKCRVTSCQQAGEHWNDSRPQQRTCRLQRIKAMTMTDLIETPWTFKANTHPNKTKHQSEKCFSWLQFQFHPSFYLHHHLYYFHIQRSGFKIISFFSLIGRCETVILKSTFLLYLQILSLFYPTKENSNLVRI